VLDVAAHGTPLCATDLHTRLLQPDKLVITSKRLTVWGVGLLGLTWFIYVHTMATPGLIDRAGRFKGTDYIQFYVMGSLVAGGRTGALYDGTAHLEEGRRRIDPGLILYAAYPNYPPQVALLFAPMALVPFGWSLALSLCMIAVCYGASVWLVWRDCEGLRRHGALVAVLAAASPLFFSVVQYAQLSAIALLFWSIGLAALGRNRPFIAGMALGCLLYKPPLVFVFGLVLVLNREWRIVAGAAAAAAGQLVLALLAAGVNPIVQYAHVLWTLFRNPQLVEFYPTELHSLRGFFQLLVGSPAAVSVCFALGLGCIVIAAVRSWHGSAPLPLKWSALVLLTVLASPHLIAYDLVVLTLPLLVLADWAVRHPGHPLRAGISLLLVLVYFAPFSSIIARFTGVQFSVLVMVALAWRAGQIQGSRALGLTGEPENHGRQRSCFSLAIVAPRCDAVSSQNSTTRG
jgi:Glycosyltransferase family 87